MKHIHLHILASHGRKVSCRDIEKKEIFYVRASWGTWNEKKALPAVCC